MRRVPVEAVHDMPARAGGITVSAREDGGDDQNSDETRDHNIHSAHIWT